MSEPETWKPVNDRDRLQRDADYFLRHFRGEPLFAGSLAAQWLPLLDISETDAEVTVEAELPGLATHDVDVHVQGDILTIEGRKKAQEEQQANYFTRERYTGFFQRQVQLPSDVKGEDAKAVIKNGILVVRLPKVEKSRSRRVDIDH